MSLATKTNPRPDHGEGAQTGSRGRAWHAATSQDLLREFAVDPEVGLGKEEARSRLEEFGPNRLQGRRAVRWHVVLLRQFRDILIGILAVAAGVSFLIGETLDGGAILAILIANGLLGFVQEWRAERSLAALQKMLSPYCTVVRGGREQRIEAEQLVPGDIVTVAAGDRVPADLRILSDQELELDESALTGESISVPKDSSPVAEDAALAETSSMAWMGTVVTSGHARTLVVSTGMSTEFGRIAKLTDLIERDATPLQKKLHLLGKRLGALALLLALIVAVTGWLIGEPGLEMFMTGVSLAVAVVPEGLPAVVTVTLSLGVRQMIRKRALPRRLQTTETLGAATTILTDKTGTLTENEMTVSRIWLPSGVVQVGGTGYTPVGTFRIDAEEFEARTHDDLFGLLDAGLSCCTADITEQDGVWERLGEPTEAALVVAARKAGLRSSKAQPTVEIPFSSDRKRMTVLFEEAGQWKIYSKGAPEVIIESCTQLLDGSVERTITDLDREQATKAYRELASSGMRTLALARRFQSVAPAAEEKLEANLTLLGIVGIIDPPRPEVPDAIARARAAGIHVTMITGDAPETALAIASEVGLRAERAITGRQLDTMENPELLEELGKPVLFARTTPEHKLRIVKLLKDSGEVVGMTGDGVNDAPALKEADIGIAMGVRGTEVAREAADLILTDDNFASIVNAVEEGRREFCNLKKFVRYLLSSNIGETVAIFLTILLCGELILIPVQILWINVVTDSVIAIALGLEPLEKDSMRSPPHARSSGLLDGRGVRWTLAIGAYIGITTVILYMLYRGDSSATNLATAQSVAFTAMVLLEQVNLFNHRSLTAPLGRVGFFTNPWLLIALAGTVLLHFVVLYVPFMQRALSTTGLGWREWFLVLALSLPLFVVPETIKWLRSRRRTDSVAGSSPQLEV